MKCIIGDASAVMICVALAAAILLGSAETSHGQGTLRFRVTFDGYPDIPPDDIIGVTSYLEGGMLFRGIGESRQIGRSGGGSSRPWWPYNGSAFLLMGFQDALASSSVVGRRFGLISVDLSEFSDLYQTPATVRFIGYLPDGSTVTTNLVTDGIIDGTGPLADFQTFYFDSRFADLVRVEIPNYGWALDNMVFANVPEPSPALLLLAGGLLIAARLSRKRENG